MRRALRAALKVLGTVVAVCVLLLVVLRVRAFVRERVPRDVLQPAAARRVGAGDLKLSFQQAGPRSDSAVVLVHGTGAWSEIWRPEMTALSGAGLRVVAFDMPPFGFSDRSPTGDYTPASQARRIWAVLDSIGVLRPTFVGHSFGARATVLAAMSRPERVERLVLIDAALGVDTTIASAPTPGAVRLLLAVPPLRDALVAATITNPWMTRRLTGMLVAHPEHLTDAQITMLQRPFLQRGSTAATGAWLPGFLADSPDVRSLRGALARFDRPTHIVWGELDSLTPVSSGEDLSRLLPCTTWDVLRGSGHIPGLEAPDSLSAVLVRRLRAPAPVARCPGSTRTSRASR